jgi:hypothetical protein
MVVTSCSGVAIAETARQKIARVNKARKTAADSLAPPERGEGWGEGI